MERRRELAAALALCAAAGCVQAPHAQAPQHPAAPPASPVDVAAGEQWTFGAAAYSYFVPDDRDFVQPTVTADRGALHFEARYNYEAQDTGSLWAGWNLAGGEEVTWEVTPMLGGVVGEVDGVAPGYKGTLGWRQLELYSEGEYLISTGDSSDSFFYNWSELTFAPADRLRVGIVAQRTRAFEADREIERGLLVGWAGDRLQFTAYVFDLDESKPLTVVSVGLSF